MTRVFEREEISHLVCIHKHSDTTGHTRMHMFVGIGTSKKLKYFSSHNKTVSATSKRNLKGYK